MPVKVRCGECESSFQVPDKVRGKTISCPKCSGKIKVPGGDAAAPAKAAKSRQPKDGGDDDFLKYGDLESQDEAVCPFCAKPVDMEEDEICPSCGRDLATGQMDKKEAKRRSKAGKSTAHFYKNFIRDCWEFTLEFKALAIRTGLYNMLFTLLYYACLFMVTYCEKMPPKVFWIAMTSLMYLGLPGWFWFLSRKIVSAEIYGEKLESDRIHFDFFSVVALGLGLVLWPVMLALPLLFGVGAIGTLKAFEIVPPELLFFAAVGIGGFSALCAAFVFPIATIHAVARHNHKAWILVDLLRISFKNIGPVMIYHLTGIILAIGFVITAVVIQMFAGGIFLFANVRLLGLVDRIVVWFLQLIGESNITGDGFVYNAIKIGLVFLFAAISMAPIFILAGFPTIFMMRLNALIAKHFQHSLELDQQIKSGAPASIWVRFLAGATDAVCFPFSALLVTQDKRCMMLAWAFNGLLTLLWIGWFMEWFPEVTAYAASSLWFFFMHWMYFSVPLANPGRATLGMEAFGLIAMRDNPVLKPKELEKEMTLKEATVRWICFLLVDYGTLLLACLSALFRSDKKMPQDLMSKTKIVFKGDR